MKRFITKTFEFFEFGHLISNGYPTFLCKLWLMGNKEIQYYLSEYTTKIEIRQNNLDLFNIFYNNRLLTLDNENANEIIFQKAIPTQVRALKITKQMKIFKQFDFDMLPKKLIYLSINATNFTDATLKNLPEKTKLKTLDFTNCNNFTNNFGKYLPENLETLIVDNSNVLKFTTNEFITYLPCNLTSLSLHCGLTEIPDSIENLSCLKLLNLRNNNITKISEKIVNLSRLEYFCLNWNKLQEELPTCIGKLSNLKTLELSFNNVRFLPDNISLLKNLEHFDCSANELLHVTAHFKYLKNIKYLKLCTNQLYFFPTLLTELTNLQEIDISGNKIKKIPDDLTGLSQNLQILKLGNNRFQFIPDSIEKLTNLVELYFEYNQLVNISAQIGNLSKLKILNLSNNELENIPKEIGNLKFLKVLWLHNNKLSFVPEELGNLTNLTILELQQNNLQVLPESLLNLKFCLQRFYVHLNPGHYFMKENYKKNIGEECYKKIVIF